MAVLQIPADNSSANYSFRIDLENVTYTLGFHFNTRMNRWTMDIGDGAGNPVVTGIPLIGNSDLTGRYQAAGLPPGRFFLVDTQGAAISPEFDDLGGRVLLAYLESNK